MIRDDNQKLIVTMKRKINMEESIGEEALEAIASAGAVSTKFTTW
jgi:hypothetical protein